MMVSLNFSPAYPTVQSPTTPRQQSYPGGITDWSRASFIPSPLWQGPSSHAPWLLHRWNALIGLLGSFLPSETQQQTVRNSESANAGSEGKFDALQRKNVLPERPG
ncbi:zinc finger ccch domain-containing protein zfn-like [Quercus suber]|uniref:Zinc finger ccch domain-containing protein zfn-like n=1 Tax=Quercus suber TaxID=58331 RepID=A0AAW0LIE0_QUESU